MNIHACDKNDNKEFNLSFVNFNQDFSSLIIGGKLGFKIFNLKDIGKTITKLFDFSCSEPILVERLFSSSLVIVVEKSSPSKISLLHLRKKSLICSYTYASSVVSCKINRTRLVVCLEDSLVLHSIKDMRVEHTIHDIPLNTASVYTLSPHAMNSYLAYPGSNQIGNIFVFDTINLRCIATLDAHESLLSSLSFNSTGDLLATSSIKGTVIRVFAIPSGSKIYEFRRGVKRCVNISSLSFSACSEFLSCASNTETIHLFRLDSKYIKQSTEGIKESTWMNSLSNAIISSASYLPTPVTDIFGQERAYAHALLTSQGQRNICGIIKQDGQNLIVCAQNEKLFIFEILPEGGECKHLSEHDLKELFISQKPAPQCFELPLIQSTFSPGLIIYSPTANLQSPMSNKEIEVEELTHTSGDWTEVKKGSKKPRTISPDWVQGRGTYAGALINTPKPTDSEIKIEGRLKLIEATVSLEDLYEDAGDGWLDDPSEFPPFFGY